MISKACSYCVFSILFYLLNITAKDQWIYQSEKKWDQEWSKGAWTYQEKVPVERSRIAVIGGVLIPMYSSSTNSSILEIGCGEGAVSDFLKISQMSRYVGVDISQEAITLAKKKRSINGVRFIHSAAHKFQPSLKFDIIVFSEVLYYTEYEKILDQYSTYLTPKGIIIISIFQMGAAPLYANIFLYAQSKFQQIDELEISGRTKKKETDVKTIKTAFRIEVYRAKV